MSEINSFSKNLPFQKTNNISITGVNFLKRQNTLSTNLNNNFSLLLNTEENNNKTDINKLEVKKNTLFVKKINLKESKYNYFSKVMKNIFLKPKYYLENYYKGKRIIIGKKKEIIKDLKINKELLDFKRKNNKRKPFTSKGGKNLPKFSIVQLKKANGSSKSFLSSKLRDTDKITTESNRSYKNKKDLRKTSISDYELKLIYKEVRDREKFNKNKEIDFFMDETAGLGELKMLDLQEKILKIKNNGYKRRRDLLNKIINKTFRDKNHDLMDQKKQLLTLKTKKIDKELTTFSVFYNISDYETKNWAYNLRKKEEEKCFFTPQKKQNKEIIYYNSDLSTNSPVKEIKKIFYKKINKEIKKDGIRNNKIDADFNSFQSLNIKGEKLLDHEIKINSPLLGKAKKIFYYNYNKNEISPLLIAQSSPKEIVRTPRIVNNSFKLH